MLKTPNDIVVELRGPYANYLSAVEDPVAKKKRQEHVNARVNGEIAAVKVVHAKSLDRHQDLSNEQAYNAKAATATALTDAINVVDEAAQIKAVKTALQQAFANAVNVELTSPDFSDLRQKAEKAYKAIVNDIQIQLSSALRFAMDKARVGMIRRPDLADKIQEVFVQDCEAIKKAARIQVAEQLAQLRNVLDYGYPDQVDGFAQRIENHPYYSACRERVSQIDAELDKLDKKTLELVDSLAEESTTHALDIYADLTNLQRAFDDKNRAAFNAALNKLNQYDPNNPVLTGILRNLNHAYEKDQDSLFNSNLTKLREVLLPDRRVLVDLKSAFKENDADAFELALAKIRPLYPTLAVADDLAEAFAVARRADNFFNQQLQLNNFSNAETTRKVLADLKSAFKENDKEAFELALEKIHLLYPTLAVNNFAQAFAAHEEEEDNFNQLLEQLNNFSNTETANNQLALYANELTDDLKKAFKAGKKEFDAEANREYAQLKQQFKAALDNRQQTIAQLLKNPNQTPEQKKEALEQLYLEIAKTAYEGAKYQNNLQWDQIAVVAKAAAAEEFEKSRKELQQYYFQRHILPFNTPKKDADQSITLTSGEAGIAEMQHPLEPGKDYNLSASGKVYLKVNDDGTAGLKAKFPTAGFGGQVPLWQVALFTLNPVALAGRAIMNKFSENKAERELAQTCEEVQQSLDTFAAFVDGPVSISCSNPEVTKQVAAQLKIRGVHVVGEPYQSAFNHKFAGKPTNKLATVATTVAAVGATAAAAVVNPISLVALPVAVGVGIVAAAGYGVYKAGQAISSAVSDAPTVPEAQPQAEPARGKKPFALPTDPYQQARSKPVTDSFNINPNPDPSQTRRR